ncbi:MAG: hypothetical protein PHI12_14505 [Dehalococcoidales bacterium]|nr:hypothetical protein [Methanoregulaceae archaeon]MDD5511996.1 hypothetical protein [Dehalococcoidales bacterium]
MSILEDLLAKFQADAERANQANEARYREAMDEYNKIIELYSPGGAFGQGFEAQLERARTKSVAQGTQQLVSSGLYGTTTAAGLGKKFEEEVGTPARQQMEDIRYERLASARAGKAGLIERREDVGPDYGLIAQLAMQASSAPSTAMGTYDPYGGRTTFGESSFPNYGPSTTFNTPTIQSAEPSWQSTRDLFNRKEIEEEAARKARLATSTGSYNQLRLTPEELQGAGTVQYGERPGVWYSGW